MTTTRWTRLISVRIDLDLLEQMKKDVEDKKNNGQRYWTLSSLINRIIQDHYFNI